MSRLGDLACLFEKDHPRMTSPPPLRGFAPGLEAALESALQGGLTLSRLCQLLQPGGLPNGIWMCQLAQPHPRGYPAALIGYGRSSASAINEAARASPAKAGYESGLEAEMRLPAPQRATAYSGPIIVVEDLEG